MSPEFPKPTNATELAPTLDVTAGDAAKRRIGCPVATDTAEVTEFNFANGARISTRRCYAQSATIAVVNYV